MLLFTICWIGLSFIYLLLDFYLIRFITSFTNRLKLAFIIVFVLVGPVLMFLLGLAGVASFLDKSDLVVFKRKPKCQKPGKSISSDQI